MPSLFPSFTALSAVFSSKTVSTDTEQKQSSYDSPRSRYQVWSVIEDTERKASDLSQAAANEYQKASSIAQAKAGKIELYSGKYCK
jgi:solute carrier family 25 phosphate transporter 3